MDEAKALLERAEGLQDAVKGMQKIVKKIRAEIRFLEGKSEAGDEGAGAPSVSAGSPTPDDDNLGSNLPHLTALVDICATFPGVVEVERKISVKNSLGARISAAIDVIADNGATWIRVTARNPKGLLFVFSGHSDYGKKSIVDTCLHLKAVAQFHPHRHGAPRVVCAFAAGAPRQISDALQRAGVGVHGAIVDMDIPVALEEEEEDEEEEDESEKGDERLGKFHRGQSSGPESKTNGAVTHLDNGTTSALDRQVNGAGASAGASARLLYPHLKLHSRPAGQELLNVDVSSMICIVSDLTNGFFREFEDPVFVEMARQERAKPVMPDIDAFLDGKYLIACETAVKSFRSILHVIAGDREKERAKALMEKIEVVPDAAAQTIKTLPTSARIKPRSLVVFGTGAFYNCATLTSNAAFLRSAEDSGVIFPAFVHEGRALTETQVTRSGSKKVKRAAQAKLLAHAAAAAVIASSTNEGVPDADEREEEEEEEAQVEGTEAKLIIADAPHSIDERQSMSVPADAQEQQSVTLTTELV